MKKPINSEDAPQAIRTYSQAVSIVGGRTVYLSGQIRGRIRGIYYCPDSPCEWWNVYRLISFFLKKIFQY